MNTDRQEQYIERLVNVLINVLLYPRLVKRYLAGDAEWDIHKVDLTKYYWYIQITNIRK